MAPTKTKATLKWSNLAEGLCPKCSYKLMDPIDDKILCESATAGRGYDCGFVISKRRKDEIVANMQTRGNY